MIDILKPLNNYFKNDKKGSVLDSFLKRMIELLENYGEKATDGFWVELLTIITESIKGLEKTDEIYAKSNQ